MLYQPILALATGDLAGYEALARFPDSDQGPLETFAAAWAAGRVRRSRPARCWRP
jgi:EAL domain-containing protein (putative c-di-GMP-specific phosphodiesterase class I)